ncbi:Trichodiene synthase [Termitomyces sp. T112]|nr:Trichodiene synthase [Termitomyces sp. T112]KAH0578759.1 hypothetical protein H2248_003879 [Termitomyces sp. 'cryptogamus']KNZ71691.1 Trichodiene synthase [Termitomyces sp. J132]
MSQGACKSAMQGIENIKAAVKLLLAGVDYKHLDSNKERQESLVSALRSHFSSYGSDAAWFETACSQAAMLAELGYKHLSYDEQLLIAQISWLVLCMEDLCHKFPSSMERLQLSILSSEAVEQDALNKLRTTLCGVYLLWDSISANCIASSMMEYVNGCLLELQAIPKMKLSASAQSWPDFIRGKTGAAAAFSFMIFPKNTSYDIADFIQVIPDIMIYINLGNDVLSFYKETLANETDNYIHCRALVDGKSVDDTLSDISHDAIAAYSRVSTVLRSKSPSAYESWKTFANGYISWHLDAPRYRLKELEI